MLAALAAAGTAHNIHSKMPQHDPEAWCGASLPRNVVQSTRTFVHGGRSHEVEVLQELPAVVAVRGFATAAECASLNEATDHWLSDPRSRRDRICNRKDCGCWFDVLLGDAAPAHRSSPAAALTNRTAALLRSLSDLSPEVSYAHVQPPRYLRMQTYNAPQWPDDAGAWCAPHCDSACNGEPLNRREAVAVAMASCRVAEEGGETSLSYGEVVYQATGVGDLVLFGLKQTDETADAAGRTEHAGCPVWRGEKLVATIRLAEGKGALDFPRWPTRAEAGHDYYDAPLPGQAPRLLKGDEVLARAQELGAMHEVSTVAARRARAMRETIGDKVERIKTELALDAALPLAQAVRAAQVAVGAHAGAGGAALAEGVTLAEQVEALLRELGIEVQATEAAAPLRDEL